MKKIQYHQFNPDFYKIHTVASGKQRPITEEELELLLQHNIHYHAALHKHGALFKNYILTHYSPSGIPVVPKGAFFAHLERTDPRLARDLDFIRTKISEAWYDQVHVHHPGSSSIRQPEEVQGMINNMLQDENTLRALTTSNPDSTSSHSPSSSPTPDSPSSDDFRLVGHPPVIDSTTINTATTTTINTTTETHTVTTEVEPDLILTPNLQEMGFLSNLALNGNFIHDFIVVMAFGFLVAVGLEIISKHYIKNKK
jgi:hypothetical protein